MGKTSYSGPVYGSKCGNLWSYGPYTASVASTGGTTGLYNGNASIVVPPYEDWYITEAALYCSTNSSVNAATAVYIKSEGGSTVVPPRMDGKPSTVAQTIFSFVYSTATAQNSTTWSTWATAPVTAGEYEGTYVPAGSSIRVVSSGVSLIGGLNIQLRGYIRWISSTRAES